MSDETELPSASKQDVSGTQTPHRSDSQGEKNDLQECFCLASQPLALATICEAQHY